MNEVSAVNIGSPFSRFHKHWKVLRMHDRKQVIGGEPGGNDRVHLDDAELPTSDVIVRVIEGRLCLGSSFGRSAQLLTCSSHIVCPVIGSVPVRSTLATSSNAAIRKPPTSV